MKTKDKWRLLKIKGIEYVAYLKKKNSDFKDVFNYAKQIGLIRVKSPKQRVSDLILVAKEFLYMEKRNILDRYKVRLLSIKHARKRNRKKELVVAYETELTVLAEIYADKSHFKECAGGFNRYMVGIFKKHHNIAMKLFIDEKLDPIESASLALNYRGLNCEQIKMLMKRISKKGNEEITPNFEKGIAELLEKINFLLKTI